MDVYHSETKLSSSMLLIYQTDSTETIMCVSGSSQIATVASERKYESSYLLIYFSLSLKELYG